jgi:hypothetical protein
MRTGWHQLIPDASLLRGPGRFPLDAYSEFLPPPLLGWKPYGDETAGPPLFDTEDPSGWHISEYEEGRELEPGMEQVGRQVICCVRHLMRGEHAHGVSHRLLADNPYWPDELAKLAGKLPHEHHVALLPLALSRTQDDKGRVRWTLFGCSEQGPSRAFWKSWDAPPVAGQVGGPEFLAHLLRAVFHEAVETPDELLKAGFRILPQGDPILPLWAEHLPEWAAPFVMGDKASIKKVKYLLTFRPFGKLPKAVKSAYAAGELHLLPCPGSLVFWGVPRFLRLHQELPLGLQGPLLQKVSRHRAPHGLRVPQSGLMTEGEKAASEAHPELVKNTYKRTHRWDRVLRDQDELALLQREGKLLHVLFSSLPDDLALYDKPMARNVQLWLPDGTLLLDGPSATPEEVRHAMQTVTAGGVFGYRFLFPAMRVGSHEVYWHRPLVGYQGHKDEHPTMLADAPLGYLTAYAIGSLPTHDEEESARAARAAFRMSAEALTRPVELWPRLHRRPLPLATLPLMHQQGKGPTTARNVRKLFDAFHLRDNRPLPRWLARQLIHLPHGESVDHWVESLKEVGLAEAVDALLAPEETPKKAQKAPSSLTFAQTAKRSFEVTYWKTIATLAEGRFLNKNNADCVRDPITQRLLPYHGRHLDDLGDYLLAYYRKAITAAKMGKKALTGSLPFRWETDFDFSWMGGWLMNREAPAERNLLTVIPGKDRTRAVIMADHYDTAYMHDRYETEGGPRLSACGADDNHSATAALMLAAPIFLEMSKKGQLGCDVWLVHLTGEEFPADCLGARELSRALVEGRLTLHSDEKKIDLSGVKVEGVYVSDMIAHNNHAARDIFQMAPGTGPGSWRLAEISASATEAWNELVPLWNAKAGRKGLPRGRRSPYGNAVPEAAAHLALHGQIRPVTDPRSTLYNTDGQIFSDAGIPVVLFMENYDINRVGYHDIHDTMANIDLDYGAALAGIVIESVARAACAEKQDG